MYRPGLLKMMFLLLLLGFPRLLENPGKSWIFLKISRPWKVLESEFGLGKSWNLLVIQIIQ